MYQQNMTKYYIVLGFLITVVLFYSCRKDAEPETFLIPNNYEGAIVLLFDQNDGLDEEYSEGRRIYRVEQNGLLKTQFSKTKHGRLDQDYYYIDSLGVRTQVLEVFDFGNSNPGTNYVMNGIYGMFTNNEDSTLNIYPIDYSMFTIGKSEDKDSLQVVGDRYIEKVQYHITQQ